MIRDIIHQTKQDLLDHPKLIKYSFFYMFCHSLTVMWFIIYNVNNVLYYRYESGISLFTMLQYFIDKVKDYWLWTYVIILWILIAIGYFILYPVWISTIIHFIKKGFKNHSGSVWWWLKNYFTITEFNWLAFSFGTFTFLMTLIRLYTLDILSSTFAMLLIIIWWMVVVIASVLRNYAKYYIILQWDWVYDWIRKSITLTFNNFGLTIKATIYQLILYIYFLFRMSIILIVPLLILYLLVYLDAIKWASLEWILWILGAVLVIFTSYMGSIVWVYFDLYWYKMFVHLEWEE